jgi:signal transduction histidine kinase/two-component SAPR family response regulator
VSELPIDVTRSAGQPARILVVDDDERNLLALSEVLSPIAKVVTASSGRDALRRLLKEDYAVILLDVFMPGLDGYETAGLIRDREQTARIPIIFLSAVNKETEHLVKGYEMGAVDYVFKPVDPLILKSKVSVFVDLYKMRRQIEEQALAEQALLDDMLTAEQAKLEAERALRAARETQAMMIGSLPIILFARDLGADFTPPRIIGGDLEGMTGYLEPPSLDQWQMHLHPEDRERISAAYSSLPDDGWCAIEYRWKAANGEWRHFFEQSTVFTDTAGGRSEIIGSILDVTQQKSLEAQLVHAGKLDALGRLTGGVAHDFNNLLAAILGGIHVLDRRVALEEREQRVVKEMRHAAEQGAELVRRMMSFARQQDLTPTSVDPASLSESVAGLVSHALGGTVVVNWNCESSPLNLYIDRGQLELALMNLIINARDAMPDGGEIDVTIEPLKGSKGKAQAVRVRVADQGVGIPADILSRVTEPFFTTKESGKGTGLGLSMVAGFAQQSGGTLEIDSAPGKGTRIDLVLPATEAPARDATAAESAGDWLSGKQLMLIDDDDSVRVVLAEQLRDLGAEVDDFATGRGAINALRQDPDRYDLVLSDFAMPKLNGVETLAEIERLAPRARCVLMTGYADDERLIDAPNFAIVRKPIDMVKLSAAFEDAPTRSRREPEMSVRAAGAA